MVRVKLQSNSSITHICNMCIYYVIYVCTYICIECNIFMVTSRSHSFLTSHTRAHTHTLPHLFLLLSILRLVDLEIRSVPEAAEDQSGPIRAGGTLLATSISFVFSNSRPFSSTLTPGYRSPKTSSYSIKRLITIGTLHRYASIVHSSEHTLSHFQCSQPHQLPNLNPNGKALR